MIIRTSTVLAVALLIAAFAGPPVAAGEWATKEDAIAMVRRAVAFITQQGREKAYAEITKRSGQFHDRDLYITVLDLDGKILATGSPADLPSAVPEPSTLWLIVFGTGAVAALLWRERLRR